MCVLLHAVQSILLQATWNFCLSCIAPGPIVVVLLEMLEWISQSFICLHHSNVNKNTYPLFDYFKSIDKSNPCNLIKFNIGNEYAVDLFKQKKIKYIEILQLIEEITSLNIDSDVNNIDKIIQYHETLKEIIQSNYT